MQHTRTRIGAIARSAAALLTVGLLAGCSSTGEITEEATPSAATESDTSSILLDDGWARAATTDDGMSAVFGTLVNTTAEPLTVVSGESSVAGAVELHEVVMGDDGNMVMQPKEGGFEIPANGEHVLEPGADHIMLMSLNQDLEPGAEISVTLTLSDGQSREYTVPVKPSDAADENYDDGSGDTSDSGMDMSSESPDGAQ